MYYTYENQIFYRFLAMFYDSFIAVSVAILASFPYVYLFGNSVPASNFAYKLYLFTIIMLLFAVQWSRGGQTLGMQAWKIKVFDLEKRNLSFARSCLRFVLAMLTGATAISWLWALVDRDSQTLFDRLTKSQVVKIKKD